MRSEIVLLFAISFFSLSFGSSDFDIFESQFHNSRAYHRSLVHRARNGKFLTISNVTESINGKYLNNQTIIDDGGSVSLIFDGSSSNVTTTGNFHGIYTVVMGEDGKPYLHYTEKSVSSPQKRSIENQIHEESYSFHDSSIKHMRNGRSFSVFNSTQSTNGKFVTVQTISDDGGSVTLIFDGTSTNVTTTGQLLGEYTVMAGEDGLPYLQYTEKSSSRSQRHVEQSGPHGNSYSFYENKVMQVRNGRVFEVYNSTYLKNGGFVTVNKIYDNGGSVTLIFNGTATNVTVNGHLNGSYSVAKRENGTPYLQYTRHSHDFRSRRDLKMQNIQAPNSYFESTYFVVRNGKYITVSNITESSNGKFMNTQKIKDNGGTVTLVFDGETSNVTTTGHLEGEYEIMKREDGRPYLNYHKKNDSDPQSSLSDAKSV